MYKKLLSLSRLFVVVVLISAFLLTSACITIVPTPTTPTTPATYMLTVNLTGSGTVIKNPDQLNYINGTSVQLAATPNLGWGFADWSGDLGGNSNPATITMDANKTLTANFVQLITPTTPPLQYTLTTSISPTGTGSIGLSKSGPYHYGDVVQLTASPATGWTFSGWSGDATGNTNPLNVTMSGNKSITANFVQNQYTLTVAANPAGSGTVTKSPDQATYISGAQVQVTATPSSGWSFSGWSGDASGNTNPLSVTMNSNKTVTATFVQLYTLTVAVNPAGSGTVTKSPDQATYTSGSQVQFIANPATGWVFSGWSGDASGNTNPLNVTTNSNKTVTATFVRRFTLSTSVSPAGSGAVSLNPPGGIYDSSMGVSLTATAASGYTFDYWSGGASGTSATTTITMTSNQSMVANFKKLYQHIETSMPSVPIYVYRTATYNKQLQSGAMVDGNVLLSGQVFTIDNTHTWDFWVLGPGGETIQHWTGNINDTHAFNFTASYAGIYSIKVSLSSTYNRNLAIDIWPPGWQP